MPLVAAAPAWVSSECRTSSPNGLATWSSRRRPERPPEVRAVARALDLAQHRCVHQPVGDHARLDHELGEARHHRADRDSVPPVGVEARELAERVEARERLVPVEQLRARPLDRVARAARVPVADDEDGAVRAEALERAARLGAHDCWVVTGAGLDGAALALEPLEAAAVLVAPTPWLLESDGSWPAASWV